MRTDELHASRSRIYSPEGIPVWDLTSILAVNHIQTRLKFEQAQPTQPDDKNALHGVMFRRGRAPAAKNNAPATIDNLSIGNNQLDLTTRDPDGHIFNDVVLQEFNKLCDEISPGKVGWMDSHRFEVFLTIWVGQLELNPDDLIDARAKDLLKPALSRTKSSKGTRTTHARGLIFRIATDVTDPELRELGLQIPDEEFRLEPRIGRLAHEQMWFSTSNLRSEDHLRLLEEIERAYRS